MPEPTYSTLGTLSDPGDTAAQAVIDAAREMREVRPEVVDPARVIVYRDKDGGVSELDLEHRLASPQRATGTHAPGDLASLIRLVKDLDATDTATVWVHPTSGRVEAVFDDHGKDGTGHGEHRAVLRLEKTPAWEAWLKYDGRLLPQQDFAEHVEARIPDIASPDGATLMEIIGTLSGKTSVNWRSGQRLQDGSVQLTYTEEATAKAGTTAAPLDIPQKFTLAIQPFVGLSDRVPITARLRYRLNGGDVSLGYLLDQPEDVLQDAITNVHAKLDAEFARVYVGSPR
jgi:uncharacterized protein YfdQ (DUF2303 family)